MNDFSRVYSYSKINRFEKCPLDYYFYYLDPEWKGYSRPKPSKTIGLAVHNAITLFYHSKKQKTFSLLKECLLESWFSEFKPEKKPPLQSLGGFKTIEEEKSAYKKALLLLKTFWSQYQREKQKTKIFYLPKKEIKNSFSEYEELITPIKENIFISGKFDRLDELSDGSLRVVDFKTGNKDKDIFQLEFYKILAELNFKKEVKIVSFYYLAKKKIIDFNLKETKSEDIKQKLLFKIEKIIKEKNFSPKPSGLCRFCDFKEVCSAFKK